MKISLIGFGNLGQGLANVLQEKEDYLREKSDVFLDVVAAVDSGGAVIDEEGINIQDLLEASQREGSISEHIEGGERGTSQIRSRKGL